MRRSASPSLTHVLHAAVFTAVALRVFLLPVSPNDSWWHLATGRLIIEAGAIPIADVFSYTYPGTPWFDQPWLAQIILFGLHQLGGVPLLVLFVFLALAATFALLLRLCTRISGDAQVAAALLLVTLPASSPNWSLRSQIFALPLFVGFLVVLTEWRAGGDRVALWPLPVLMVLWVNVHGSFVLGVVLIGVFTIGVGIERHLARRGGGELYLPPTRHLLIWGAATVLATLANPRGPAVVGYVVALVGDPAVQGLIQEWQAPRLGSLMGSLLLGYGSLVVLAVVASRRRPETTEVLTFMVFLVMALLAERHLAWFVLATTPLFVASAARIPRLRSLVTRRLETPGVLNRALIAAFGVLVLAASPWLKPTLPWPSELRPLVSTDTPEAAVAALHRDSDPPSRLFHTEAFGSYLMWADPQRRVYIDTRVELYPLAHWQRYLQVSQARQIQESLALHDVDGLLLDTRRQSALAEWAVRSAEWEVRYRDQRTVYLVKAR